MLQTGLVTLGMALFLSVATLCGAADKATLCPLPMAGKTDSSGNLIGKVTQEQLYKAFPSWRENASHYAAKSEIIEKLHQVDTPVEIVMLFGTWCKDSRSEVPKFLKVLDAANNTNFSLRMYAVDRSKKDCDGLSETRRISRVPTMVFLRNGKELGRIVEYPTATVEEDFLALVTGPRRLRAAPQGPQMPKGTFMNEVQPPR
ncbi:MAG: thioredoxin [Desulfuromonadales bacterium]|nr:MAG: thioredoxin [Desulfuromonadales bacterium]